MPMRLVLPVCTTLMLACLTIPGAVAAQRRDPGCPAAGERTCGEVRKLTVDEADTLLAQFKRWPESQWGDILEAYFGALYSKDFLNWVVFIQKDGTSRQGLFDKGRLVESNIVRGHQSLAVLVFAESNFKSDSAGARQDTTPSPGKQKTDSLRLIALARDCKAAGISCSLTLTYAGDEAKPVPAPQGAELHVNRTTLQYTRDAGLIALLKGLTAGAVGPAPDPTAVPDSSVQPVRLEDVIKAPLPGNRTGFYFGYRRLQLPLNALVRFTLRPNRDVKADFPNTTTISRTIENASRNRFGASLGTGLTLDAPDSTFAIVDSGRSVAVSSSSSVKPRLWVMAHFAIIRPLLPIRPQDLSVLVGTNLSTDDLFRDLLLGLAARRLIGDVGVVGGLNFIQRRSATPALGTNGTIVGLPSRDYRRAKWFVGIDFAL